MIVRRSGSERDRVRATECECCCAVRVWHQLSRDRIVLCAIRTLLPEYSAADARDGQRQAKAAVHVAAGDGFSVVVAEDGTAYT